LRFDFEADGSGCAQESAEIEKSLSLTMRAELVEDSFSADACAAVTESLRRLRRLHMPKPSLYPQCARQWAAPTRVITGTRPDIGGTRDKRGSRASLGGREGNRGCISVRYAEGEQGMNVARIAA